MLARLKHGELSLDKTPTYFVTCGVNECPVLFFHCDGAYSMAPTNIEDLATYYENIVAVRVKGIFKAIINLE